MQLLPLEPRRLFSNPAVFDGITVSWTSTGSLNVNCADEAVKIRVTETTFQNATERMLMNQHIVQTQGYNVFISRAFALNTAYGFEGLTFLDGSTYDDAASALHRLWGIFNRVLYVQADNGLNVIMHPHDAKRIQITLGSEDDVVSIGKMNRPRVVVNGGAGDDTLVSSARKSTLNGEAGNDVIHVSLAQRPVLRGGSGNDRLFAARSVSAVVDGGKGKDLSDIFSAVRVERVVT